MENINQTNEFLFIKSSWCFLIIFFKITNKKSYKDALSVFNLLLLVIKIFNNIKSGYIEI